MPSSVSPVGEDGDGNASVPNAFPLRETSRPAVDEVSCTKQCGCRDVIL